uniref:Self-incompatibility associated ribonuclease S4 n=2 Tax=Prunus TaxID=3754 RepID=G8XUS9_9ROSA|nr:self-incompatibility associated ribonuclease S4 [Prunus pseudocerasus]
MAVLKSSPAFLVLAFAFAFFLCFIMSTGSYVYFQFVQQWPPTNCRVRIKRPCSNPRPLQIFTIHGLWPSNYSNPTMPSNCIGSQFNETKLSPKLRNKLKRSWPNVESGNDTELWEHEWNKHGTCAEQTLNQMQYFQRSHGMWYPHSITEILKNASIVPSPNQTWTYSDIVSPIKKAIRRTPLLRCKPVPALPKSQRGPKSQRAQPNSRPQSQLLHEVVYCYDYDALKLIDCNRTAGCWNNVDIKFPP